MNAWLNDRSNDVRASISAIAKLKDELSYLQLGWRPPDGGWSIAQVFEHLILADESYLAEMEKLVETGKRSATPWQPTLAGGMLTRYVSPGNARKTRAPRIYRPPEPRAHVVDEYLKVRERLLRLLERADGIDLRRNRMSSPVSKIIRINLGDAIMILVVHTQRHLQQVARIRDRTCFPS